MEVVDQRFLLGTEIAPQNRCRFGSRIAVDVTGRVNRKVVRSPPTATIPTTAGIIPVIRILLGGFSVRTQPVMSVNQNHMDNSR